MQCGIEHGRALSDTLRASESEAIFKMCLHPYIVKTNFSAEPPHPPPNSLPATSALPLPAFHLQPSNIRNTAQLNIICATGNWE